MYMAVVLAGRRLGVAVYDADAGTLQVRHRLSDMMSASSAWPVRLADQRLRSPGHAQVGVSTGVVRCCVAAMRACLRLHGWPTSATGLWCRELSAAEPFGRSPALPDSLSDASAAALAQVMEMHDDDVTGFAGLQLFKYHTRPRAIYTPSTSDDAFLKVSIWSASSVSSVRVERAASDGVHQNPGTGLERLFHGRGSGGGFPTRRQQRRRRRSRNLARRDAGYGAGGVRRASREEVSPPAHVDGVHSGRCHRWSHQ